MDLNAFASRFDESANRFWTSPHTRRECLNRLRDPLRDDFPWLRGMAERTLRHKIRGHRELIQEVASDWTVLLPAYVEKELAKKPEQVDEVLRRPFAYYARFLPQRFWTACARESAGHGVESKAPFESDLLDSRPSPSEILLAEMFFADVDATLRSLLATGAIDPLDDDLYRCWLDTKASYDELAERFGVDVRQVKASLRKVREKLRSALDS